MKSKSLKLIIKIIVIIITLNIIGYNFSYSASDFPITPGDVWNYRVENNIVNKTESVQATIINAIRYIALGIAVIMLTYIAIKYMIAAPEGKAEYKKSLTGYVVGVVVLFATSWILTIIRDFINSTVNNV